MRGLITCPLRPMLLGRSYQEVWGGGTVTVLEVEKCM